MIFSSLIPGGSRRFSSPLHRGDIRRFSFRRFLHFFFSSPWHHAALITARAGIYAIFSAASSLSWRDRRYSAILFLFTPRRHYYHDGWYMIFFTSFSSLFSFLFIWYIQDSFALFLFIFDIFLLLLLLSFFFSIFTTREIHTLFFSSRFSWWLTLFDERFSSSSSSSLQEVIRYAAFFFHAVFTATPMIIFFAAMPSFFFSSSFHISDILSSSFSFLLHSAFVFVFRPLRWWCFSSSTGIFRELACWRERLFEVFFSPALSFFLLLFTIIIWRW